MYSFQAQRRNSTEAPEIPSHPSDEAENRLQDIQESESRFIDNEAEMQMAQSSAVPGRMEEGSSLHEPPESLYKPPGDLSDNCVCGGIRRIVLYMSLQSSDISDVSSDISTAVVCHCLLSAVGLD